MIATNHMTSGRDNILQVVCIRITSRYKCLFTYIYIIQVGSNRLFLPSGKPILMEPTFSGNDLSSLDDVTSMFYLEQYY